MFDCHVHSNFSSDSKMSADEACLKAISLGLQGIAFTDHLDLDYPAPDNIFEINFCDYSIYMNEIKSKYKSKLKVMKGIEVGFQPHVMLESKKVIAGFDFDFVIGSVHVIDKKDPYYGNYFIGKSKEQSFNRYLEEIYHSIVDFSDFDVIGHIGYIRRYGDYDDRSLRYIDYRERIDSIFKEAIQRGIGIEVNSSGLRGNLGTPMPDYDIIRCYKELGGEIISIGSDAHFSEHVGSDFSSITKMLKELGFKYTTHFERRKPIFDKL